MLFSPPILVAHDGGDAIALDTSGSIPVDAPRIESPGIVPAPPGSIVEESFSPPTRAHDAGGSGSGGSRSMESGEDPQLLDAVRITGKAGSSFPWLPIALIVVLIAGAIFYLKSRKRA